MGSHSAILLTVLLWFAPFGHNLSRNRAGGAELLMVEFDESKAKGVKPLLIYIVMSDTIKKHTGNLPLVN